MSRARSALLPLVIAIAAALGAALPASAQQAPPDVPAGDGRIVVHVVHATTGEPMQGIPVLLYALTAGTAPGLRRGETGADGSHAFDGIATAPQIAWLVGARHQGLPFPGSRVAFEPGTTEATAEIRIRALDPDPARLEIGSTTLRLARDAAGLRVVESITLQNPGDTTYYVPAEDRTDGRPAVATRLPDGADHFEMPLGVVPEGVVREGSGLRYFGPVYPGPHELGFAYVLAPAESGDAGERFRLDVAPPEGADELELWLPAGLGKISGAKPHAEGATELEGRSYERFVVAAGGAPVFLELPPARIDPDAVRVARASVRIVADDAALDVTEDFLLEVTGDTQVLGTAEAPLVHVPLPANASDLRFGTDAGGIRLAPHPEGGLAAYGTLGAGESWVSVSYQLPVTGAESRLERRFGFPIPLLSVFIADDGDLETHTDRLHRRRPMRTQDRTYIHLEAFQVDPDETIELGLTRQPARARLSPGLGGGIGAVAAVAVIALILMPLWNERGGRLQAEDEGSEEEREREAVYAAIADLEHDFETGKVAESDYEQTRAELRARAVDLMRQERETQPGATPLDAVTAAKAPAEEASAAAATSTTASTTPGTGGYCPACGGLIDPAWRFCSHCGGALSPPADSGAESAG
jgi:hypothetical protein